ncbi:aspartyl-tRNA synthetase [Rhypophila decipiens]|uniref:aspartate--tRNA ligase n=1 Tax=Rhypophila decipiens TaxID=261697 RepID=A0AAN6YKY4_9PEZI|nr:aspartyl-tRNA synthetase [Rhypophila decipiens]
MGSVETPSSDLVQSGLADQNEEDSCFLDARVHSIIAKSREPGEEEIEFLLRRAGEFFTAVITSSSVNTASFKIAETLTIESLVRVTTRADPQEDLERPAKRRRSTSNHKLLQVYNIKVLSRAKSTLPEDRIVTHGASGESDPLSSEPYKGLIEDRLDNRLLDARVSSTAAIFKIFSGIHELAVQFLRDADFYHIATPALVSYMWPGEEDDHFSVPYLDGKTAWLAPTSEVHLSMALAADMQRVYDIHTVFRREPKSDGRHLTEFTMLELVFALKDSWTEILDLADDLLVYIIRSLKEKERYKSLTQMAERLYPLAGSFQLGLDPKTGRLPRITFRKAKSLLRDSLGLDARDEDDLSREEEAALGKLLSSPSSPIQPPTDIFIITHYPRHIRACNVYPSSPQHSPDPSPVDDDKANTTHSFDIILAGQEIVTGCQLLHSYQDLREAFLKRTPPIYPDSPEWRTYMAAHELGMPPWGGFGLGINRLVQGFLGLADIRETVLFPRDASRLAP